MAKQLITIKTTPAALQLLRLIAAMTGKRQYEIMEYLFKAEIKRLQKKHK